MSFDHLAAAADLELGNPTAKLVLIPLASAACATCGIAWPGVTFLCRKTGLGSTAVRKGLDWLTAKGFVLVHAYPKGGRGRSTEYVVLPGVLQLSTAPCGECAKRMKTPREALGIGGNPPLEAPKTHREALTNQSENHNQSARERARPQSEAPASRGPIVTPPLAPPGASARSGGPVQVGEILRGVGAVPTRDVPNRDD